MGMSLANQVAPCWEGMTVVGLVAHCQGVGPLAQQVASQHDCPLR